MKKHGCFKRYLHTSRGQILLPSVLLVPLFILVVYLLFDLTNLSMTKVQHQYALDNAAYTQMTTVSSYLNSMAMINGPSLYRVMIGYKDDKIEAIDPTRTQPENVFNLFYKAGAFPSVGQDHENGGTNNPSAESVDWDVDYYPKKFVRDGEKGVVDDPGHKKWMVPHPKLPGKDAVVIINSELIKNAKLTMDATVEKIAEYLKWVFYLGSIYDNQTYSYDQLTRNAYMFREGYFVNTGTCKPADCAKQSARVFAPYLKIRVKPFDVNKVRAYFNDWAEGRGVHEPIPFDLTSEDLKAGRDMFLFSYLTPESVSLLRKLDYGIVLKQPYKTRKNHFKQNLDQKYKPYTRVKVMLQCPRKGNNCVWPNPLPKYSVLLRP